MRGVVQADPAWDDLIRVSVYPSRVMCCTVKSSNQPLERTADRRENLLFVTSTPSPEAKLALVSGRSALSR
jgi:hypothetical protein